MWNQCDLPSSHLAYPWFFTKVLLLDSIWHNSTIWIWKYIYWINTTENEVGLSTIHDIMFSHVRILRLLEALVFDDQWTSDHTFPVNNIGLNWRHQSIDFVENVKRLQSHLFQYMSLHFRRDQSLEKYCNKIVFTWKRINLSYGEVIHIIPRIVCTNLKAV